MNATPEWIKDLDQQATEAQEEEQYDAEADQRAELEGEAPPEPELELEGEEQTQERVQQAAQQVPLATLLEERKKFQQQIDEERQRAARFERLEDELRRLRAERQGSAPRETTPPKAPPPDYLEDPKGYVDSSREELIERLKKLENVSEQASRQTQQLQFERQVQQAASAAEATFARENPDYLEALSHVRTMKSRELAVSMPDASPAQLQQLMNQAEIQWAAQMLQRGLNPAEQAYKLAQALGYQRQEEQNSAQQAASQAKQDGSGVDRRRLQGMGGGNSGRARTDSELENLMAGSADEFDQAMSELFGRRRQ